MRKPNKYGCIPCEDVCLKHDEPLTFKNGCSMANYDLSEKIYKELLNKGAVIGNASIFIIQKVINENMNLIAKDVQK